MTREEFNIEIKKNYEFFRTQVSKLSQTNPSEYALVYNQEIIDIYKTYEDTYIQGVKKYGNDKPFSVQKIENVIINLGFYSLA